MKKLVIIALASVALTAMAAPLTPEQALEAARATGPNRLPGSDTGMTLVDTRMKDSAATVYTFCGSNGFMVTAADDCVPVLLGYGNSQVKNAAGEMSPEFNYWLDFLSNRVRLGVASGGRTAAMRERPERDPIPMLCTTEWNQDEPYNLKCPRFNGALSVTGCAATSTAQVMKYHNWPPQGTGSLTYEHRGSGTTITTDFSSYTFLWDDMLDEYISTPGTGIQKAAVANLMRAVGGSIKMNYSPSASGAYSQDIPIALTEYFSYDKNIGYALRDYYTLLDWEEMVYNSLRDFGPVIYNGQANVGGHSFVCDGYQSDGYFHINWGWGGMSDGYFLLDVLDPYTHGIGGADSGFNADQDMIFNITPDTSGESVPGPQWMYSPTGFKVTDITYAPGDVFTLEGDFWNYGPYEYGAGSLLGLQYESLITGEITNESLGSIEGLGIFYGYSDIEELPVPELLPDGIYRLVPSTTFNCDTLWNAVKVDYSKMPYVYTIVADNSTSFKFKRMKVMAPVTEELIFPETITEGLAFNVSADLYQPRNGRFNNKVRVELYDGPTLVAYGPQVNVVVASTEVISFEQTIESLTLANEDIELTDGEYNICLSFLNGSDKNFYPLDMMKTITYASTSGIAGMTQNVPEIEEWFTLDGMRIENPRNAGIYIKRTGNRSEKVIIR